MSPRPEYLRLCSLLDCSLGPFSDLASDSLNPENEKELLIALSQIFKQVKQWTHEFDYGSTFVSDKLFAEPIDSRNCSISEASYFDNSRCLAKIIGDLVFLFAVNNIYAQHLVGNILVAISEFVITSGNGWDSFIHLLCLCLKLAICSTLSSSPDPNSVAKLYSDHGSSIPHGLLKLKPENANWSVVAAMVRVLHNTLKYIKQDSDDKIIKAYLDSVSSLFLNVQWDLLSDIYVNSSAQSLRGSDKNVSLHIEGVQPREIAMFYGNILQFLCSLVELSFSVEDGVGSLADISGIRNLLPKLMDWFHAQPRSCDHVSVYQYSRHKMLMLMVKLSSPRHTEETILVSWLHLLHKYFEDLLLLPMTRVKADRNSSLEGSPFCYSISDPGKQYMMFHHLQRLAILLFLRVSFNLITIEERTDEECSCENMKHCLAFDVHLVPECCIKCRGVLELQNWIQSHIPADTAMNHELYFQQCVRFTLSFLQLYMDEDDILFEMLLQLLYMPFYPKHQNVKWEDLFTEKNYEFFLALDLFNPIILFHLFLAEILYDHQVLLDYLISKDTGSSCAEFLIRSLRLVCNSWKLFVEFPGVEEGLSRSQLKRQKVTKDNADLKGLLSSALMKKTKIPLLLESEHDSRHTCASKRCRNCRLPFMAAGDCLTSLRTSIDSLNQKNLFPYNPQALLRRLPQHALNLSLVLWLLSSEYTDENAVRCESYIIMLPSYCSLMRFEELCASSNN